jgi:ribosomal protein S18 acetylase RimI-like enzyme
MRANHAHSTAAWFRQNRLKKLDTKRNHQLQSLTIRNARPQDLEACNVVETNSFLPSEAASKQRIEMRINQYPQGFLVAELNGRIVGHLNSGATFKDDISDEELKALIGHDPNGGNLVIFSLAVMPQHRKRGIAGQLLKEYISRARQMQKNKVLLLCKNQLVRYYQGHGFVDLGLSASTHGGAAWHEMALRLD